MDDWLAEAMYKDSIEIPEGTLEIPEGAFKGDLCFYPRFLRGCKDRTKIPNCQQVLHKF